MEAVHDKDAVRGLIRFDKAMMAHAGYFISNMVRTFLLGLTGGFWVKAPAGKTKGYYQQATRFSSALAFTADVCMAMLGSNLKRKESLSARLGDILSYLYLLSGALKLYQDQGRPADDLPLVRFSAEFCLFHIQESFDGLLKNFLNRPLAWVLRGLVFPLGMRYSAPKDRWNHKIAQLLMGTTDTRARLAEGAFLTPVPGNALGDVQDALMKCLAAEPVEKIVKTAHHDGLIGGVTLVQQAQEALTQKIITMEAFDRLIQAEEARQRVIHVDDFAPEDLPRLTYTNEKTVNAYAKSIESPE